VDLFQFQNLRVQLARKFFAMGVPVSQMSELDENIDALLA